MTEGRGFPPQPRGTVGRGIGGWPRVGPAVLKFDRVTKPYLKVTQHAA